MSEATEEEMTKFPDQSVEFIYQQAGWRVWQADQRAKALTIRELLRNHLPPQVLNETEDFFLNLCGCESFHELLRRERNKLALSAERPDANEEEVESFLDTGVWRSSDDLAKRRAAFDADPFQRLSDDVP